MSTFLHRHAWPAGLLGAGLMLGTASVLLRRYPPRATTTRPSGAVPCCRIPGRVVLFSGASAEGGPSYGERGVVLTSPPGADPRLVRVRWDASGVETQTYEDVLSPV